MRSRKENQLDGRSSIQGAKQNQGIGTNNSYYKAFKAGFVAELLIRCDEKPTNAPAHGADKGNRCLHHVTKEQNDKTYLGNGGIKHKTPV